jgi:hypothetical protein
LIAIVGFLVASSILFFFHFASMTQTNYYNKYGQTPRAAIIDQLYDDVPNLDFQETAKKDLQYAGYTVDLYTTKNITVGFYKNLPLMEYKFIIIRSHASLSYTNNTQTASADLFTGEKYRPDKYTLEQIQGLVDQSNYIYQDYGVIHYANGSYSLQNRVSASGSYFSVGSKFVDQQMQGKFPGTIVLIGGCASLSNPILADSLVKRGTSAIIGWNKLVTGGHNDAAMLAVLNSLLVDKSDVADAIKLSMDRVGPDPEFSSVLKYYPASAGSIRVGVS